jgi:2Fe-2S ferredoxin
LTEPHHRLACQARVLGDVVVRVPEAKWENQRTTATEAWG